MQGCSLFKIVVCDTSGVVLFMCVYLYITPTIVIWGFSLVSILFIFYFLFICLCLVIDVRNGFPQLTRRQNCGFLPDPNPVCLAAWDTSSNCNVYFLFINVSVYNIFCCLVSPSFFLPLPSTPLHPFSWLYLPSLRFWSGQQSMIPKYWGSGLSWGWSKVSVLPSFMFP